MILRVEKVDIPIGDFKPKRGGVYAMVCQDMGVFAAIEAAFRLARASGFDDETIIAEHFYFQRDFQQSALRKELERLSISGWSRNGIMIVIPGLSKKHFEKDYKSDEVEVAAFLFSLRKQLDSLEYPVFVPFHTKNLAVDESVLTTGLATMGFTRISLLLEDSDKSCSAMLLEGAFDEAASMAVFPDTLEWPVDEGDE